MSVKKLDQKPRQYPDLTKIEGSVGQKLEALIKTADSYETLEDLKKAFLSIINDPDCKISKAKKYGYTEDLKRMYSHQRMIQFITNVYLKSANLGLC